MEKLTKEQLMTLARISEKFWVEQKEISVEYAVKLAALALGYVKE